MNKREKILAVIIAGLGLLFAVDRLVVAPLTSAFEAVHEEAEQVEAKLTEADAMVRSQKKIKKRWSQYRLAGLAGGAEVARIRVQSRVTEWSRSARLRVF